LKRSRILPIIAFMLFGQPWCARAADAETLFECPRLSTGFASSPLAKYTVPDTPLFSSLLIAPDGKTAWVGTYKAVLRFSGRKHDEFRRETVPLFEQASCYNFKPLAFDAKGTLWVSLRCHKGPPLATFEGGAWKLMTPDLLPLPEYVKNVEHMVFDKNHVMWLVTYSGLLRYDGKAWTLFTPENSPLPERQITALSLDPKGTLWIGTTTGSLASYDGTKWEVFKAGVAPGLPAGSIVKRIKFATNGGMYFTNNTGGAFRFAEGKCQVLKLPCAQTSFYFKDLAIDAKNTLWAANDGISSNPGKTDPGLFRFDGKKCSTIRLPNDTSSLIEIDEAGNKWIGTRESLVLFREGGVEP